MQPRRVSFCFGLRGATLLLATTGLVAVGASPALATDVSSEAQLRAAFENAAETTIVVTADISLTNCGAGFLARNSGTALVISGSGAGKTITQTCGHRIFYQDGNGAITIQRLTLEGVDQVPATSGGAIYTQGDLTVEDSTIRNNASGLGAAIASAGAGRTTTILRSTITGNSGVGANATVGGEAVGAIWSDGPVVITDSTISNNTAQGGNGSNGDGGDAVGAVFTSETLTITDSTISGNEATGGSASKPGGVSFGGDGVGALRTTKAVTVTDSTITGNSASGGSGSQPDSVTFGGGAVGGIDAYPPTETVTITDTTIADNLAFGGGASVSGSSQALGGSGTGGLRHYGTTTLDGATFTGNRGSGGSASVGNGIASGGFGVGAAGRFASTLAISVTDSTIADNAGTGGFGNAGTGIGSGGRAIGGLFTEGQDLVLERTSVVDNEGTGGNGADSSGGGGIGGGAGPGTGGIEGYGMTIHDAEFVGNVGIGGEDLNTDGTNHTGGDGVGAVHHGAIFGGELAVRGSTFSGNRGEGGDSTLAGGSGTGAIYTRGKGTIVNSTVSGNTASAGDHGTGTGKGVGGVVGNDLSLVYTTTVANSGSTAANVAGILSYFDDAPVLRPFAAVIALPEGGPNCADLGTVASAGYNLDDDGTCGLGVGIGDRPNSAATLALAPLADNGGPTRTRLPGAVSVLVDAIPTEACDGGDALAGFAIETDQRGEPRPAEDGCDVGAVEVQPAPPPPPPIEEGAVTRLSGPDRIATAAAIAADRFTAADTVFLATSLNFPDALAGGPLAARLSAPILLTGPGELAEPTRVQLDRLKPKTVVVLGGTAVVPQAVADAAAAAAGGASIQRLSGADRYATAAAIAERYPSAARAYLATGENFPDALTGGALAAARDDGPIVLTRRADLPDATAAQLDRLEPGELVVLGGTAAVPAATADAAATAAGGATVTRLGGADRFVTAALIGAQFPAPTQAAYIATGLNFPDALAGTPAAAQTDSPILLTTRDELPPDTIAQLERLQPVGILILGGTAVVSDAVATQLATYLR
jgi:putative cell wall-binding protein